MIITKLTYHQVNEFIIKEKLKMAELDPDSDVGIALFNLIVAVNEKHKSEDNEDHF